MGWIVEFQSRISSSLVGTLDVTKEVAGLASSFSQGFYLSFNFYSERYQTEERSLRSNGGCAGWMGVGWGFEEKGLV